MNVVNAAAQKEQTNIATILGNLVGINPYVHHVSESSKQLYAMIGVVHLQMENQDSRGSVILPRFHCEWQPAWL